MESDEMYLQVPKEVVDEVAEPLSIIFGKSQQSNEVPKDWKRGNIFPLLQFLASCPPSTFPHDSKSQGKGTAPKYCPRQDINTEVVKIFTNTPWPQGTI